MLLRHLPAGGGVVGGETEAAMARHYVFPRFRASRCDFCLNAYRMSNTLIVSYECSVDTLIVVGAQY